MSLQTDFGASFPNMRAAREQAVLVGCAYQNRSDLIAEILALDGGNGVVVASQFNPNGMPPSWWMIRQDDIIYIANAGTTNSGQWGKHLSGALGDVVDDYPKVVVHPFFYQAGVKDNFAKMKEVLGADIGKFRYRVSGHSFGGATSNLIARQLVRLVGPQRVQVMTYGEPRSFAFTGTLPDNPSVHWRFDKPGDIVTSLPPVWARIALALFELRKLGNWQAIVAGQYKNWKEGKLLETKQPGLIATWKHTGRQAWLWDSGDVQIEGMPRPDRRGMLPGVQQNLVKDHDIPRGYWPYLKTELRKHPNAAEAPLVAIGDRLVAEWNHHGFPDIPIQEYANPSALQAFMFKQSPPPLTKDDVARAQSTALFPSAIRLEAANKDDFPGSSIVADFWDVTLAVNNITYGKSQTFCLGTAGTLAQTYAACESLIKLRAALLGREGTEFVKEYAEPNGLASPCVELLRIRDPKVPRFGQVFDVPYTWGEPSADLTTSGLTNAADPLWNAISMSLYASIGAVRKRYTLTLVGLPDRMIQGGAIQWSREFGGPAPKSLAGRLTAFLNELTNSPRAWGLSGQDPAIPVRNITAWDLTADNELLATSAGHGYVTGERVSITRTKVPSVNKVWEVRVEDANSFSLIGSQYTPVNKPTGTGQARRWANKDGVRDLAFYRFEGSALGAWGQPFDAQVRKREPGRRITRVSFSRRERQG